MSNKNSHHSKGVEDGKINFMQLSYAPNNCIPFMEYYSKKLKAEFSTFGQCVLLGTEPDHRAIHNCPAEADDVIAALVGFHLQMKIQAEKEVVKSIASWNEIKIKIAGDILIHLSRSSENRMMQEPTFQQLCNDNDPVKLFDLIKKVHTIEQDGDVAKRTKTVQMFNTTKQGNQEYYSYCRRFNTICDLMKGVKRDKSDEEKVEQFMISLNPDIYKNEVARLFARPAEMPKDLATAQQYFGSWGTSLKSSFNQMENNNIKGNKTNNDVNNEQINFTKHNNKNITNNKSNNNNNYNNKNNSYKNPKVNSKSNNNYDNKNKQKNQDKSKNKLCVYCEIHHPSLMNTHWTQDCYKIKASRNEKANVINHYKGNGEHEEEIGCVHLCNSVKNSTLITNSKYDVYYDTCATIGVIKDQHLLTKIINTPAKKLTGVGGQSIIIKQKGYFAPFGWQLYSKEAKFNILSHENIISKFNIYYDNQKCQYTMTNKTNNNEKYYFIRTKNGLYKYMNNSNNHDMEKTNISLPSIEVDEVQYSAKEVERCKDAIELHARLNHISDAALTKLLDHGSILNCNVSSQDLRKARKIYGPCNGCLFGKMTAPMQPDSTSALSENIAEILHCDIYYLNKQAYLISVEDMRGLISIVKLDNGKSTNNINSALQLIINKYKSWKHQVKYIRSDRESVFLSTVPFLNQLGVQFQTSAPGQHVAKVERAIRTIKGRYRSVINTLPYKLPTHLYPELNLDVVQTINITPNINTGNSNPRELVVGVKIDAHKVLRAKFGDVVISHIPNNNKNNDLKAEIGLVVGRDFTDSGTIKFWNPDTNRIVARQKFTIIPITEEIIKKINSFSTTNITNTLNDPFYQYDQSNNKIYLDDILGKDPIITMEEAIVHQNTQDNFTIPRVDDEVSSNIIKDTNDNVMNNNDNIHNDIQNTNILNNENNTYDNNINDVDNNEMIHEDNIQTTNDVTIDIARVPSQQFNIESNHIVEQTQQQNNIDEVQNRKGLVSSNINKNNIVEGKRIRKQNTLYYNKDHVNITTINKKQYIKNNNIKKDNLSNNITIKNALIEMPNEAKESIAKELKQIIELKALNPIMQINVKSNKKILHSKTFLKKKYLPNKVFEKLKSRLVIRGDMQFRHPWKTNNKAPTVAQASVNMTISISAYHDNDIESIDITGAYLRAHIPPEDREIVLLGKEETKILISIYPEFEKYLLSNGTMLLSIDRAMYGMIESAFYWYTDITSTLISDGYLQNSVDECVFFYIDPDGNKSIIDLWSDDLLHSYTKNCVKLRDKLRNLLKNKYKDINIKEGNSIPYCGMLIEKDLQNGGIFVSAPKFLEDLLKSESVTESANSPTNSNFLNDNNNVLSQDKFGKSEINKINKFNKSVAVNINNCVDKTKFASKLMKLMWIARLCRNDILFAVSYLSTKVQNPTIGDMNKLDHILKYLNGTKDIKLKYKPESLQLHSYIDASYALHNDAKGQTGIIITLGKNGPPIFCKSRKQKLVSRSSTESELIALNEGLPEVMWAKQFMENIGFQQNTITVYEDNQSSIVLANKNKGSTITRTKHIQVRFFYVKQLIEQNHIKIEYLPTEEMVADILTKPITGKLFIKLRNKILNITT